MKSNMIGLKKNYEFRKVYNHGKSFANPYLVLFVMKNKQDKNKVGFSVSKKIGKSVVRNKVKRRLKECYRHNSHGLKPGHSFIFLSRGKAKEADYKTLNNAMINLFKKANVLKDN